jgi:acetyl-CoA carboxylase carboxyltransferase component
MCGYEDAMAHTASSMTFQETTAADIEALVDELVAFIESTRDVDWHISTPAEDWTLGVVAHHIAVGLAQGSDWLELARLGNDIPGTVRSHDDANASHAREFANATRAETIQVARANGARAAATVRSLHDAELRLSCAFGPSGGSKTTVERLAGAFRRHADRHMESIREALAA